MHNSNASEDGSNVGIEVKRYVGVATKGLWANGSETVVSMPHAEDRTSWELSMSFSPTGIEVTGYMCSPINGFN